jgi:hypothetical protein
MRGQVCAWPGHSTDPDIDTSVMSFPPLSNVCSEIFPWITNCRATPVQNRPALQAASSSMHAAAWPRAIYAHWKSGLAGNWTARMIPPSELTIPWYIPVLKFSRFWKTWKRLWVSTGCEFTIPKSLRTKFETQTKEQKRQIDMWTVLFVPLSFCGTIHVGYIFPASLCVFPICFWNF